jgi:hypothetical protein
MAQPQNKAVCGWWHSTSRGCTKCRSLISKIKSAWYLARIVFGAALLGTATRRSCVRVLASRGSALFTVRSDAANHIAVSRSHDFKTCNWFNAAIFEEHVAMLRAWAQAFKLRVSKTAERSAASHPLGYTTTLRQIRLSIIRLCAPSLICWLETGTWVKTNKLRT